MAAPEVKRGEFLYRDTLFVDLGEKRHPRASASELKDLLLPKKGSAPAKDQVAHWYEAQLIHYGLPRTRDKNTAKVRLTTAVVSGALVVPTHISQMEAHMKKEYAAAVRRAKAAATAAQASKATDATATKGKKRKANDNEIAPGTTISLKIGDVSLEVGIPTAIGKKKQKVETAEPKKKATPASKAKATAEPKAKATSKPNAAAKQSEKPKPVEKASVAKTSKAKLSTAPTAPSAGSPSRSTSTNVTPRPKQTARRGKPFLQSPATRNPPRGPLSQPGIRDRSTPSDIDMDDAPPPYESIDFDQSASPPRNRGMVQISGLYDIFPAPRIPADSSLALKIDNAAEQLWASFRFGTKSGVIRMDGLDGLADGLSRHFGWRSRDDSTGQLRFGRGCDGSIEFDGNDGVRGSFYGLLPGGDLEFVGELTDMDEAPDAEDLRYEWDEFPRIAYDRD